MMARLGDIATYINGYAFKPEDWSVSGLPIIRIQDLTGNAYQANHYNGGYDKRYEVNKGDVLISWSASLGVYVWQGEKALLNQHIFKVVFDKEEVDKDFFVHQTQRILENAASEAHGATMKHLTKPIFDALPFSLPSLQEQKQVATILNQVDALISLRKKQLQKLDDLVKSRFVEMFGDPEINPMGWKQMTIGDVCSSIVRGPFGSALKKEFFVEPDETTYKVYEQKHAIQKSASIGTYYVTAEKYNELKRFECVAGDILMSCSGTMGELYQLPEGCERGIINQALCKFTLNEKILPICFLEFMQQTIGNLETKGSGIQNIAAVSYVKAMPIIVPPIEVQERFAEFSGQVNISKLTVQQGLDKLELLKQSLMQKYFG